MKATMKPRAVKMEFSRKQRQSTNSFLCIKTSLISPSSTSHLKILSSLCILALFLFQICVHFVLSFSVLLHFKVKHFPSADFYCTCDRRTISTFHYRTVHSHQHPRDPTQYITLNQSFCFPFSSSLSFSL